MTQLELQQIYKYFLSKGVRDSSLPLAADLLGSEVLSVVQNGKNVQLDLEKLKVFLDIGTGGGGTDGTYSSPFPNLMRVGGLDKNTNLSEEISITELFNNILFPNYLKELPEKPVFLGYSEEIPNIANILALHSPATYNEFDYNKYTGVGYIIIALPAELYLKKIEDSNNLNIVNSFDLLYKSVQTDTISDIYNVYISPKLYCNDNLELTFTTREGTPVQVSLLSGTFTINDIIPTINNVSITEITRAVINSLTITNIPILHSISIEAQERAILNDTTIQAVTRAVLKAITIKDVTKAILNSISISDLPLLNHISIAPVSRAILAHTTINQATRAKLNSISIVDSKSTLNSVSIVEAVRSDLKSITITSGKTTLKAITISAVVRAVLNSIHISN